jgi:hypothetical protein
MATVNHGKPAAVGSGKAKTLAVSAKLWVAAKVSRPARAKWYPPIFAAAIGSLSTMSSAITVVTRFKKDVSSAVF